MSSNIRVTEWLALSARLKQIKEEEAFLRRAICEIVIGDKGMVNGRVTVKDVIDGYDVKAVQALSYTIDVPALGTIWNDLSDAEQDCIKMKPTLELAKYRKMAEASLLHEAIVSKMAMPVLTAEAPPSEY